MTRLLFLMLVCAPPISLAAEKPRVVVLGVVTHDKALEGVAAQVSEQIMTELTETQRVEVLGSSDLQSMLGFERQKELLGCSEKSQSCIAELGAALGAPWLVAGAVAKAGKAMRVDLKLIHVADNKVVYRSGKAFKEESEVFDAVSSLSRGLLGALKAPTLAELQASKPTPPPKKEEPPVAKPPEPSQPTAHPVAHVEQPAPSKPVRVAPLSLMIGGGAVLVAGGVLLGVSIPTVTSPHGKSATSVTSAAMLANLGVYAAIAGAVIGVGGLVWWLLGKDEATPAVAFAPVGNQVFVMGRF